MPRGIRLCSFFALKADEMGKEEFNKENNYFATFPYPYMNGRLHLGHAFTISKVTDYYIMI